MSNDPVVTLAVIARVHPTAPASMSGVPTTIPTNTVEATPAPLLIVPVYLHPAETPVEERAATIPENEYTELSDIFNVSEEPSKNKDDGVASAVDLRNT